MTTGLLSSLVVLSLGLFPAAAQAQVVTEKESVGHRMTVRPRELAVGARTNRAGVHQLDAIDGDAPIVYVPSQCAGAQRCPLVVFLWYWGDRPWDVDSNTGVIDNVSKTYMRPLADKYGMIALTPGSDYNALSSSDALDAALTQVFSRFAIDPARVAIMGTCATGDAAFLLGGNNPDVFSRVIALSPLPRPSVEELTSPPTPAVEYLLDSGYSEYQQTFGAARDLQAKGYRVTSTLGFRVHGNQMEVIDHVMRWLRTSWTIPDLAARPVPQTVAEPLPELTSDVLTRMTAFWDRFRQEPDSIRTAARLAHLRNVVVPFGQGQKVIMDMVDMPALAAQYPSVGAALQASGMTAAAHETYRVALAGAYLTKEVAKVDGGTVDPTSTMGKNVAFIAAYPDEMTALETSGMWSTP